MAAAMRRAGFQSHDGLIFETLVGKGGVLVAVEDAPRAADALAVMQSYGGGNAAIGAWAQPGLTRSARGTRTGRAHRIQIRAVARLIS